MKAGFFILWLVTGLAVTSSLMIGHVVALPAPTRGDVLPVGELDLSTAGRDESLETTTESPTLALHFLFGDCPCSRNVLDQILQRHPVDGIRERIVFVGKKDPRESTAKSQGYETERVTPIELRTRYGVESAPLLVIVDAQGTILHSGGYTSRKRGVDIQDETIIRSLLEGKAEDQLPVLGCAVSKELQSAVDPLGLKYSPQASE
ncbi:MAG: hypothetical protein AAFV88_07835 [Planctomycetota bacterium]